VSLDRYDFAPRWVEVPEGHLHYVDEGSGPVLLMVHGNPTWSFLYRHLVHGLRDRFRCVAVDHLGFGLSDKPPGADFTLPAHVRRLGQLIAKLGLERVTPIVQDWGGPIGLSWAVAHRAQVERLVVMNTFAFPMRLRDAPLRMLAGSLAVGVFRAPGIGELLIQGANVFVRRLVPAGLRPHSRRPGVLAGYRHPFPDWASRAAVLQLPREIPLTPLHRNWQRLRDLERELRGWDVPTLLVWGERDPVFPPRVAERFAALLPNHGEVVRLPDASHYLQEDAPEPIVAAIRRFFG
jgi:pimeloyl-ACP methyl ester carboxylesterase